MIRVADYIAEYIYTKLKVQELFMVSGGGMMFLSDGLAKYSKINTICTHHEQAAGMAAESYAKYKNDIGVIYVTTGCGGTNTITPLLGAWQDSVPLLVISGQSKSKETIRNSGLPLRQFGVQEADIVSVVQPLTKYAVMINDPEKIAYHLDKAVYYAKAGRPGPVWLDIPLDVQSALINPDNIERFDQTKIQLNYKEEATSEELKKCVDAINRAERPVLVAGQGIYLAQAVGQFRRFVEDHGLPVVIPRLGINNLPTKHKLLIGKIGNKGDRAGNFAVQNADLVVVLGSRLSVSSTGHQYELFAREAKIIVVDIDPIEHQKNTVKIDIFINADLKKFLDSLLVNKYLAKKSRKQWLDKCISWKEKFPVCLPEYVEDKSGINLYYFVDKLNEELSNDGVVVTDSGSTSYVVPQAIMLKDGQRYITSSAQGEMGYALPGAIGVCFARDKKEVVCITGDGSLQMNIQELQTIVHHNLPVKLFVWNNDGYLSIKSTQEKFFQGRYIGSSVDSGISFPLLKKIAYAYGIKYIKVDRSKELRNTFRRVFKFKGPVICEVFCDKKQQIMPTVSSITKPDGTIVSKPLEDMYPFLTREEFKKEMIIKPIEE